MERASTTRSLAHQAMHPKKVGWILQAVARARPYLGIPKSSVEDWDHRQPIPNRKRGRRRFFLRWEIEAWLVADDLIS